MERGQLRSIIEAMVFVAEEPITEKAMASALEPDGVEKSELREALAEIRAAWNDNGGGGLQLVEVAGGYQFRTKEAVAEWVKRLCASKPMKLSPAALETMAIIAYRQPIVRAEIEHVRGVDSGGVLKKLMERRLIRIVGKRDEPGQPLIYGTTSEFLELFNLANLSDLPPLADLKDLAESRQRGLEGESEERPAQVDIYEEEEEQTVALRDVDDDEEPTEIIARLERDEAEDREALENLESNLKHVRRLEKAMFPNPAPTPEGGSEGQDDAGERQEAQSSSAAEGEPSPETTAESAAESADEAGDADEDAPQQTDRPVE